MAIPEHLIVWNQHFSIYDYGIDCDGRTIRKSDYGKLTEYGWQIDHAVPTAFGGLNVFANKRPRHWRGNSMAGGIIGSLLSSPPRRY